MKASILVMSDLERSFSFPSLPDLITPVRIDGVSKRHGELTRATFGLGDHNGVL